ncbi:MAG: hypothetical protein P1P89_06680 [Desulfobacterales bacterium]|nr:hypothetical protein [Desulfobacterales bacterium]
MSKTKFYDLVRTESAEAVLEEVRLILKRISPDFDVAPVTHSYITAIGLYEGLYPGFQACNTEFHDLRHSVETFLAMARLIHGATLDGKVFSQEQIVLGLTTSILHDAGYIQEDCDTEGTGAKHTSTHVTRSMDFLAVYGKEQGVSEESIAAGRTIILCTDLSVDFKTIIFPSPEIELLGKMLGAADLLAQMADRTYLEKLLFLYREFSEANIGNYEGEVDLLKKTVAFYDFIAHRIETTLGASDRFMFYHFSNRWNISENLYQESILRQKDYLSQILQKSSDPRKYLRRNLDSNKTGSKHFQK